MATQDVGQLPDQLSSLEWVWSHPALLTVMPGKAAYEKNLDVL
jgi:hypothetical protein